MKGPLVAIYDPYGQFGILSNFALTPFTLDDVEWLTVEHFFQAQKFLDDNSRSIIQRCSSGNEAKNAAWAFPLNEMVRSDWDEIRIDVMRRGLSAKFCQSALAFAALMSTWPLPIIENSIDDEFWGVGSSGIGQNVMGLLLEEARMIFGASQTRLTLSKSTLLGGTAGPSRYRWADLEVQDQSRVSDVGDLAYNGFITVDIFKQIRWDQAGLTEGFSADEEHALALDEKYASYTWLQDSRSATVNWKLQFLGILAGAIEEVAIQDIRLLAVGAGSANEAANLWADFGSRATLVDWGFALARNCQREAPLSTVYRARAERLTQVGDGSVDLYCALRVYDSAHLNVQLALEEAHRVLRRNGVVILSISNGYLQKDGSIVHGQIVGEGKLDPFKPWEVLLAICSFAADLEFHEFQYFDLGSEIVVSFRK